MRVNLQYSVELEELKGSLTQIETLRTQLAVLDITLSEIGSMLEGFELIQAQQLLQQKEETDEQFSEVNEGGETGQGV